MFNHRISPLFSVAAIGLSLALAGGGTYALIDQLPKPPTKAHIEPTVEQKVITVPTVEIVSPKEEAQVNEPPPVQVPVMHIPPRTHKAIPAPTKLAEAPRPQPCELVCEAEWHDSLLSAQGGRYKNCKCK